MKTAPISAQYISHHGSDLLVVNAAKASFDKQSAWAIEEYFGMKVDNSGHWLNPGDLRLIRFLARGMTESDWDSMVERVKNGSTHEISAGLRSFHRTPVHWAPFGHPTLTLRMTLPLFLARQFVKHQVGGCWSEVSRRYVSDEPEFWFPDAYHTRPDNVKQGSGNEASNQKIIDGVVRGATKSALASYQYLLAAGVAPEEARMVLPLNTMTTVVWTGSLYFWSRVCNHRSDPHAQRAAWDLAEEITMVVEPHFPASWEALCK